MKDVREALMVARSSDGRLVKRPLSPHLQVYKPQITTTLSILHRVTGVALSVGALLLVWWLVAAATSPAAFDRVQGFIGSWFGILLMLGWTFALFYHLFAGIRHLAWDMGCGFELPQVHFTGKLVVAAAVVCTVVVFILGLALR